MNSCKTILFQRNISDKTFSCRFWLFAILEFFKSRLVLIDVSLTILLLLHITPSLIILSLFGHYLVIIWSLFGHYLPLFVIIWSLLVIISHYLVIIYHYLVIIGHYLVIIWSLLGHYLVIIGHYLS